MEHRDRGTASAFSRRLSVAETPVEGLDIVLTANEQERAALAQENGLAGLPLLEAALHVDRVGAEGLEVSGQLRARARQTCVVTLEEFDADIVEPIHVRFAPQHAPNEMKGGRRDDAAESVDHHISISDEEEPPDPLIGGEIDLGAVAAEFLTLALDPYPRKPGATFTEPNPEAGDASVSPFSQLRDLAAGTTRRG